MVTQPHPVRLFAGGHFLFQSSELELVSEDASFAEGVASEASLR